MTRTKCLAATRFTDEDLELLQQARSVEEAADPSERVNHPSHYNAHPSGVECITVAEHFNFNIGNAIKYL